MSNEGKVKAPSERLVSAHDFRVGEHTKQIHRKKKRQKRGEGEWGTECESFFVGVLFIPAGFFLVGTSHCHLGSFWLTLALLLACEGQVRTTIYIQYHETSETSAAWERLICSSYYAHFIHISQRTGDVIRSPVSKVQPLALKTPLFHC